MPKKKSARTPKMATLPRRVIDGLYEAEKLLEEDQPAEAARLLEELDRRHPGCAPILEMLVNACYDQQDITGYEWACYRLLQVDDSDADAADLDLPEDEALELAVQNEQVRLFLEHGRLPQGKQIAEKLLSRHPDFVPVINNLSQIYAQQGNLARAIELCRQALAIQPDNVHALSNLVRMLFLSAQPEQAAAVAEQLKASQAPAADYWTKKAEAFSLLGDDQTVLELYKQARAAGALRRQEASLLFLHLAAVAHWNQGKAKDARRLWQKALDLQPGFDLAQQQLDDLEQPTGQRSGPWGMPLTVWVTGGAIRDLSKIVEKATRRKQEAAVQTAANEFLSRHPELIFLTPHMLQRGDPQSIDFVINLAGISLHPELMEALDEFTHGQRGRDEQRMRAAQVLSEAGLLPSGTTRMWMKGEWRDILFLSFEISPEPEENDYSPEVLQLSEEAYYALQDGEPQRAQELLEQAVALEPDSPSLLNNLAMAFEMQGKKETARAMVVGIHQRFADYFFGIVSLVRQAVQAGELDKAREMLNGLMQRRRLHYSEYDALCMAQI
jgi:tetratricopeptide (TPR) repeat protein